MQKIKNSIRNFLLLFITISMPYTCSASKIIYLTSDDGPLEGTENIIRVITEEKVPVTLFMVGLHYDLASGRLKNIVDTAKKNPYIEIANHSYSHAGNHYRHFYSNLPNVIKDMEKNNTSLGLGKGPIYARLPGRDVFRIPGLSKDDPYISKTENKIETVDDNDVYKKGFYLYGWDLEWVHDQHGKPVQSVDELLKQIKTAFIKNETTLPNKLILLMHDEMFQDCFKGKEKLKELIEGLRQENYKFDFIKNYRPFTTGVIPAQAGIQP